MPLDVAFQDGALGKIEADPKFSGGFSEAIVKAFRKRMQQIRAADTEMDLYAMNSLRLEKLKGKRKHQHSMRLNDQWRLILEFREGTPNRKLLIVGIEDYH